MNEEDSRVLELAKEEYGMKTGSKLFLMLLRKDWKEVTTRKEEEIEASAKAIDMLFE